MLLHLCVCAIEHLPGTASPTAERDLIGTQRLSFRVFNKPVWMLLEDARPLFSNKRRNPDRRLETTLANLLQNTLDVATKRGARFEPVAHRGLIAIVDLYVAQTGSVFRDEVEIIQNLLSRDAWSKAIP